jgi:hypothetical protein
VPRMIQPPRRPAGIELVEHRLPTGADAVREARGDHAPWAWPAVRHAPLHRELR